MSDERESSSVDIGFLDKATEDHLIGRAVASVHANALVEDLRKDDRDMYSKEYLEARIRLARALFDSGKLTRAEFFFHTVHPVETYYEGRPGSHQLSPELAAISAQMAEVERRYGLKEKEYWVVKNAPEEYQVLAAEYDRIADDEFATALDDAGLDEAAQLWRSDREKYDALREGGRRRLFDAENIMSALKTCLRHFEEEAHACIGVDAYYASCVMLGSAAEARLLLACLEHPNDVEAAQLRLPGSLRPRKDVLDWRLDDLIRVTAEIGWLPRLENEFFVFDTERLLHRLREIRNLLHPGRHVRDVPHAQIGEEAYDDALAAYNVLCRLLDQIDSAEVGSASGSATEA